MGLESHVDIILGKNGIERGDLYCWSDGLKIEKYVVLKEAIAKKIMRFLDRSGQFGPTRYNKRTNKIEFGVFSNFFSGGLAEYSQYCEDFKNWLVDAEGKKVEA